MKYYIIIALLVGKISFGAISPDKYYVTYVRGQVLVESTKQQVKVGDLLLADDKILLVDKEAAASFVSAKGRFNVRFNKDNESGKYNELKAILIPCVANSNITSESVERFIGQDPSTYFASSLTQNRILIVENEPFLISPAYDVEGSSFFYIQFEENGKTIKHKIKDSAQNLLLAKSLFIGDSGLKADKVSLGFQTSRNGQSQPNIIADFYPVLASKGEIVSEINVLKRVIGTKNQKRLKTEILNHLYDNYGKIGVEEVESMVSLDK